ncbi:putative F-box/LRR-repeat protein [Spatholobus suberectus]|nr:putative F-box/LRR-repeat protein [Spatholobus suberectus]
MADKISALPDAVLCHILSFLPTRVAVATSVLSKRWNPIWRSVPSLDFDFEEDFILCICLKAASFRFVQSLYAFILLRDLDQPIPRFRLKCTVHCDSINVKAWVTAALRRGVEHFDFWQCEGLPSAVFSCKTLVALKLTELTVKAFSPVDLPSLKILFLNVVHLSGRRQLTELLVGCPNMENLHVKNLYFCSSEIEGDFNNMHKFPNLTHVKFDCLNYRVYWFDVLEVVKRSPKLQYLFIYQSTVDEDWAYPRYVPDCMSLLHLKTCSLYNYRGSWWESVFVEYITQNARILRDMIITCSKAANERKRSEMFRRLSLCTRSSTCALSFKYW